MEKHEYYCNYCKKSYIPKRRGIQKYCSTSCRTRAFQIRTSIKKSNPILKNNDNEKSLEGINAAGVGNAFIGNLAYDLAKKLLTSLEDKPVTKKDLKSLLEKLEQRYLPVRNAPQRNDGTYAFYDRKSESVIYLPVR